MVFGDTLENGDDTVASIVSTDKTVTSDTLGGVGMPNPSSRILVTHNARGLGGLATSDGRTVADGVLFRSDSLSALTDEGIAALAELGIGTVVDLRTDGERARAADVLPGDGSITFIALPVLGGAMDEMVKQLLPSDGEHAALTADQLTTLLDQVPTLAELYQSILASSARQFAELARAVIAAAGTDRPGVIFHCTAGKDRTGLAAAILLSIAGVPHDTIVADYTQTETNLAGPFADNLIALITGFGLPLTPRLEELATKSPAGAIGAALGWIAEHRGDAAGYLQSGGLTAEETVALAGILRAKRA